MEMHKGKEKVCDEASTSGAKTPPPSPQRFSFDDDFDLSPPLTPPEEEHAYHGGLGGDGGHCCEFMLEGGVEVVVEAHEEPQEENKRVYSKDEDLPLPPPFWGFCERPVFSWKDMFFHMCRYHHRRNYHGFFYDPYDLEAHEEEEHKEFPMVPSAPPLPPPPSPIPPSLAIKTKRLAFGLIVVDLNLPSTDEEDDEEDTTEPSQPVIEEGVSPVDIDLIGPLPLPPPPLQTRPLASRLIGVDLNLPTTEDDSEEDASQPSQHVAEV